MSVSVRVFVCVCAIDALSPTDQPTAISKAHSVCEITVKFHFPFISKVRLQITKTSDFKVTIFYIFSMAKIFYIILIAMFLL